MTDTSGTNVTHPAEFSRVVLDAIRPMLGGVKRVHDCFAGRGVRLGALCDELRIAFSGTDIEPWADRDPRVIVGDARDPSTYPDDPRTVEVCSPPYLNRISTDYHNGPTPTTNLQGRRAYGISLGGPLDPRNLARLSRRPAAFYAAHDDVVACWSERIERVIVNVDLPMRDPWIELLERHDYAIDRVRDVITPRYRGFPNSANRPPHEVVIDAHRVHETQLAMFDHPAPHARSRVFAVSA